MKKIGKRIDVNSLEIGKKYFIVSESPFSNCVLLYVGHVHNPKKFTFTFGETVDSWINNFNLCISKSNFKAYEVD